MKKYFAAILILATYTISEAQQLPAPPNRGTVQNQAPKHCPPGFVLDSSGNCVRLEPDQLAE